MYSSVISCNAGIDHMTFISEFDLISYEKILYLIFHTLFLSEIILISLVGSVLQI